MLQAGPEFCEVRTAGSENKCNFPSGSYGNSSKISSIPDGPPKGTRFPKLVLKIDQYSIEITTVYVLGS